MLPQSKPRWSGRNGFSRSQDRSHFSVDRDGKFYLRKLRSPISPDGVFRYDSTSVNEDGSRRYSSMTFCDEETERKGNSDTSDSDPEISFAEKIKKNNAFYLRTSPTTERYLHSKSVSPLPRDVSCFDVRRSSSVPEHSRLSESSWSQRSPDRSSMRHFSSEEKMRQVSKNDEASMRGRGKELNFSIDSILTGDIENPRKKMKYDMQEPPFVEVPRKASPLCRKRNLDGDAGIDERFVRKRLPQEEEYDYPHGDRNKNDDLAMRRDFFLKIQSLGEENQKFENLNTRFPHVEEQNLPFVHRSQEPPEKMPLPVPGSLWPYYMTPYFCWSLYRSYLSKLGQLSEQSKGHAEDSTTQSSVDERSIMLPASDSDEERHALSPNSRAPFNLRRTEDRRRSDTSESLFIKNRFAHPFPSALRRSSMGDKDVETATKERIETIARHSYGMRPLGFGSPQTTRNFSAIHGAHAQRIHGPTMVPMNYAVKNAAGYCQAISGINTSSISGIRVPFLKGIDSLGQVYSQWNTPCVGRSRSAYEPQNQFVGRVIPGGAVKKRRKWNRAVFTNTQRRGLEKKFEKQKYVAKPERKLLAETLNLTDSQVKIWFQNRRMKWRQEIKMKDRGLMPTKNTGKTEIEFKESDDDSLTDVKKDPEIISVE